MGTIVNFKIARKLIYKKYFGDWRIMLCSWGCMISIPLGLGLILFGLYLFGLPLALVGAGITVLIAGIYLGAQFEKRLASWRKKHGVPHNPISLPLFFD